MWVHSFRREYPHNLVIIRNLTPHNLTIMSISANFNPLNLRNDVGQLWENFLVVERLKKQTYQSMVVNNYFWRTWDQKEVDFVEEREGKLFGYEFKYSLTKKGSPKDFLAAYPNASYTTITSENYLDFIAGE